MTNVTRTFFCGSQRDPAAEKGAGTSAGTTKRMHENNRDARVGIPVAYKTQADFLSPDMGRTNTTLRISATIYRAAVTYRTI